MSMIGKKILHYKIIAKLGEGGMPSFSKKYNNLAPHAGGVVYKAEDTKLERTVACQLR
jgi:hypothetical protein